jgi:hypothetical protein
MYLVEQMMKVLKGYVCDMSHPARSMAKGYILDEIMVFGTKYLQEFQHVSRRIWDAQEEEGVTRKVLKGAVEKIVFTPSLQDLVHSYVLTNMEIMSPWI